MDTKQHEHFFHLSGSPEYVVCDCGYEYPVKRARLTIDENGLFVVVESDIMSLPVVWE